MRQISYTLFRDAELIPLLIACAIVTVIIVFVFKKVSFKARREQKENPVLDFVEASRRFPPYDKKDLLALTLITALYAVVSLWQLGTAVFPTTTWQPTSSESSQEFILKLDEETRFDAVYAIYGEGDNNAKASGYQVGDEHITIYGSSDLLDWEMIATLSEEGIYEYEIITGDWDYRYIRFVCTSADDTLTEVGFKAYGEERFLAVSVYADTYWVSDYPATLVIDEQDKLSLSPIYTDQGYFDEIYHVRNGWEIASGQYMYTSVHPLLGTNMIALGILLLGMSPLGWRLFGAVAGIIMVPLLYGLLKLIFRKRQYAVIGSVLLAGDFMHITTSRIATLEPFSVLTIILMFYFMFKYYYSSFYDTPLKKQLLTLLACGTAMGIACATKWTACYSAVGLAVLLFANLIKRFKEYRQAARISDNDELKENLSGDQLALVEKITSTFPHHLLITLGCCFIFFIFIPIAIYALSYLPDHVWRDGWSLTNVWEQCVYMYNYHTQLTATHPYQSTWYMWIVDARPIWYYYGTDASGWSHSISCFSNPLLTWGGLIALIYTALKTVKEKDRTGFALIVGYVTALGPWIFLVKRCCFAYHFYPTSIFVILMIVYMFKSLIAQNRKWEKYCLIFLAAYILLFIVFLPVTCGFGTSIGYIKFCEWFPSWYFG